MSVSSGAHPNPEEVDLAIVGGGAAGLMTAIWAGRIAAAGGGRPRIVVLDGARRLGAKILIAGGGRCNVTHHAVSETDYAGSSAPAIRKVLRRFDVAETVAFFASIGVELKREDTGKLFPVTDSARTVLDALIGAANAAGVELRCARRVATIEQRPSVNPDGGGSDSGGVPSRFEIGGPADGVAAWNAPPVRASLVAIATGGRSVPKTGSDGHGFTLARQLGHTVTPRVFPALVPLLLPSGHPLLDLAGIAVPVRLELWRANGKRLVRFEGALLCTHFGLSGPVVLDISRYHLDALADGDAVLTVDWMPTSSPEACDRAVQQLGKRSVLRWISSVLPERLARTLLDLADVDPHAVGATLTRDARRRLVRTLGGLALPVTESRGFRVAEATAGGVPLAEMRLDTMESRKTPGLFLVGEVLDVDGRIGGFNFQWAWSSGWVAGNALGQALAARFRNVAGA